MLSCLSTYLLVMTTVHNNYGIRVLYYNILLFSLTRAREGTHDLSIIVFT